MTKTQTKERLRVLHVISGDLWAGAEAQAYTLLKHLQTSCTVRAILLNHGELAKRLESAGVDVIILDEKSQSSWSIFQALRQQIKNFRPDIVHTHREKENILGALANWTSNQANCIRTSHGLNEHSTTLKRKIVEAIDRLIGNQLQTAVVAVSQDLKKALSQKFKAENIYVVENGIDVDELYQQAEAPFEIQFTSQHRHFCIIGRLVPVKRVDLFLKLAEAYQSKGNTNSQFHVIGDGPLAPELHAQADELELTNLTFHGHQNNTAAIIKQCDAVLMCSDHEGMPMVALETLALKCPLIAHKVGGLAELHDDNLYLIEQNKTDMFLEALQKIQEHTPSRPFLYSIENSLRKLTDTVYLPKWNQHNG